jgi:NTE family protein
MPTRAIRVLASLLLVVVPHFAFAAESATAIAPRPRIGLVLSGGGARGAAHVGALKVLEELRVPIDAIAGTSMGAVVGGLYASGMSPAQIEREIATLDWSDAFRDRPQRLSLNFRRKREDREFLVQFPLGFRNGSFRLPRGLIQGQKLGQILRRLTRPAAGATRFDDLPTPFRAVATDLETGAAVVMGNGDLATALHASLAAPGIFAPVERDGRLLVDGGIAANLPIDVARSMNVDVLIVVDVGFPLAAREQLSSVASVSNQMLAILIRRESDKQRATLGTNDVLITAPMPGVSSFDFSDLASVVNQGEVAARQMAPQLVALAQSAENHEHFLASRRRPDSLTSPPVVSVQVDALSIGYAAPVQLLFGDLAGKPFDERELNRRVNRYYGRGVLESLEYRLLPTADNSSADLVLSLKPNDWGPNYVRFGLRLQDDFAGNSSFDAAVRVLVTELNHNGAEWMWEGQIGGNPRLGTELYLPFSQRQRWFAATSALFEVRDVPQFVDEKRVGELRVRSLRAGVGIGREFSNSGEARVGLERETGNSRVRLGDVNESDTSFSNNEYFARYSLDRLDNQAFPRRGHAANLEWRGQLSDRSERHVADTLRLDFLGARSWGRHTAIFWTSAGTLLDQQFAGARSSFSLGGFLNLSGVTTDAIAGPHFGIARLIYMRKLGSGGEGFLNVPMYAGISLEAGNAWERRSEMSLGSVRKDASLFFGMDTFLGPAYLGVGYDTQGKNAFYLSLGRGF